MFLTRRYWNPWNSIIKRLGVLDMVVEECSLYEMCVEGGCKKTYKLQRKKSILVISERERERERYSINRLWALLLRQVRMRIHIYIYIYWLFAPSPNHQTCLLLSRACFIQGVSKFSAARQLEKRTKECTEKTRNVTKKHRRAPQNTPTWAFGKVLGESFRGVGSRPDFGTLFGLF